jgi:hypothetical protein
MAWQLVIGLGLVLFVGLSGVDWLMTFTLLQSDPSAFEANPLAAACLERYGWSGLAVYKTAGVVVFVVAVSLIARRRPPVALGVVGIGCGMLIVVTSYTHGLICQNYREETQLAATEWLPIVREDHHELYGFKIPKRCWFASDAPINRRPRYRANDPLSSPRAGSVAVHTPSHEWHAPHRWPYER